jgi:hypothetical protein
MIIRREEGEPLWPALWLLSPEFYVSFRSKYPAHFVLEWSYWSFL